MVSNDKPCGGEAFADRFGGVYEHSRWIAEAAAVDGAPADPAAAMRAVVEAAPREAQLALLCAHPDLSGRLAVAGELTADSAQEQAGAGLDRCSPAEFAEFQTLNAQYRERFGFPFILAVRGYNRSSILAAFRRRVCNDHQEEFREALNQVHRIAALRIATLTGEPHD